MPINSECQAFRSGIRPAWEDDANANGGKWILRMKKGISSRLWEHLVITHINQSMLTISYSYWPFVRACWMSMGYVG